MQSYVRLDVVATQPAANGQKNSNESAATNTGPHTSFPGAPFMAKTFEVGDHVSWNSEAGRVSGHVVRVHTKDVNYKGYVHHASVDDPQYEIKSDKTDHIALHKAQALQRLGR